MPARSRELVSSAPMVRVIASALTSVLALSGAACGGDDGAPVEPIPEICAERPFSEGCPCLPGASASCYDGDDETIGVGGCTPGRTMCLGDRWGACEGEVAPRPESCDAIDDDCDGLVDEGVLSPCGGCTPGCDGAVWGDVGDPFAPDEGTDVALGPLAELTLARAATLEATTVWIANSADATVSKIDAIEAVEVARYRTGGLEPSRVAVDYLGDAWIANRELDGGVSSVVKIAGTPSRCIDADGDGLETSAGPADVLPFGTDECVMLHSPVGTAGEVARALAIDGDRGLDDASGGNAWVGLHDGEAVVALDGITGMPIARVETPGFQPYAAVFDPWGTLWLASRDGFLARIDRRAEPPSVEILEVPLSCFLLYGMTADARGRLVLTGFSCDDVVLYDPARNVFRDERVRPSPRGVAILGDEAWVAHTGAELTRVGLDPLAELDAYPLSTPEVSPLESIGVGVDGAGMIWVASSQGGASDLGVATRFDPGTGAVTAQVTVGRAPHTQGDLTGAELVGGFAPEGTLAHVFDGCTGDADTEWARVHVALLAGATGSVEVAVRRAADRASLPSASFAIVATLPPDASPIALALAPGGVLEVRLVLRTTARDGAPLVRRVGVEWACPGPG